MADTSNIIVQTERRWGCLAFLFVFVIGVIVGFLATERHFRGVTKMLVKSDTTYIYDTTRIVAPPVTNYIHTTDTMLVVARDTLVVHDTTYVVLQKEVKEYRGEEYYAKVSGYRPSLDFIEVYPKTTIINNTQTLAPKKNFVSLGLDVGYVGSFRAPVFLEYERRLDDNFSMHGRLVHDLHTGTTGVEVGGSVIFGW